jgi:hypothetical protein
VTVNYRYLPAELEENHERFVRGEIQVSSDLASDHKEIAHLWQGNRKDQSRSGAAEPRLPAPLRR